MGGMYVQYSSYIIYKHNKQNSDHPSRLSTSLNHLLLVRITEYLQLTGLNMGLTIDF